MHPCHDCPSAIYVPIGSDGELACTVCGRPVPASEAEPETALTQCFWNTVRANMFSDAAAAIQYARQGFAEPARYFARSAAHNALYLEQFDRLRTPFEESENRIGIL